MRNIEALAGLGLLALAACNSGAATNVSGGAGEADAVRERPVPCIVQAHGMGAVLGAASGKPAGTSCDNSVDPQRVPLDEELIRRLLATHEVAVTVEEAAIGGLGAHVLTMASDAGLIDAGLKLRTMRLPDRFQDQDKPEKQYAEAGLDAEGIVETVLKALRHNSAGVIEGARA